MDAVHLSAVCAGLVRALSSRIAPTPKSHVLNPNKCKEEIKAAIYLVSTAAAHALNEMRPRQTSTVLWALGKMRAAACMSPECSPSLPELYLETSFSEAAPKLSSDPTTEACIALLQRLTHTLYDASGRDLAQALYGAALISRSMSAEASPLHIAPAPPGVKDAIQPLLLTRIQEALPSCQAQDISMLLYSLAVLQVQPSPELLSSFMACSKSLMHRFSCQALSNSLWALAVLHQLSINDNLIVAHLHQSWQSKFVSTCMACMGMMNNQELSITAWSMAKLRMNPGTNYKKLLESECWERIEHMNGQDLSLMLTAMAEIGHQPAEALMSKISQRISTSSDSPASGTAVHSGLSGAAVHSGLSGTVVHSGLSGSAVHGGLSAAVRRNSTYPQVSSRLPKSTDHGPQGYNVGILYPEQAMREESVSSEMSGMTIDGSRTTRQPTHEDNVRDATKDSSPPASAMEPLEACRLLCQMAKVAMSNGGLASVSISTASLPSSIHNSICVDNLLSDLTESLSTLSPGRLSSLLHALALLQHQPHQRWTGRLTAVLRTRLPWMNARELATTLWSLARLGIRPEGRCMDWLLLECQQKLQGFGAQELGNTVWAISRLGFKPHQKWLASYYSHSSTQLQHFKLKDFSKMMEAVIRNQMVPPRTWGDDVYSHLEARAVSCLQVPHERQSPAVMNVGRKQKSSQTLISRPGVSKRSSMRGDDQVTHFMELYSVLRSLAVLDAHSSRGGAPCLPVLMDRKGNQGSNALLEAANIAGLLLLGGERSSGSNKEGNEGKVQLNRRRRLKIPKTVTQSRQGGMTLSSASLMLPIPEMMAIDDVVISEPQTQILVENEDGHGATTVQTRF
ncbi:hypothetical protein CEUSTIGMA_g1741.t1 [Chlamydomonas eustigma]|uniref:RAP domain-containing protein n=1 Tax=Chlamydomonas eustigma TaxID=1157962 RepID=A0A250WUI5_9CHLO|nr:hypothetical protein CEUSTIGMA_g1741.t1 [Chlamydomonas eustigma]|eukprot:GAX74292.1 hypothetical protein CEUSTIGMA_g1741.t1 [Chlamydomonas eustigma]